MSVTVTFANQPANKQSLKIVNKLSQGKFKVYHAQSSTRDYAVKVFPKDSFGNAQYQKETIMFNLSHKNIIKSFPVTSVTSSESSTPFSVIITELAKNSDVFDLVIGGLFDSEILIRTYFHQLVEGLEYIHSQGVAHLDLKLENLMMGSDFTLKIIDFDQAQKTTDKKITSGGTQAFRAPEVIDGSCKNFQAADIYSAGIILYALKATSTPFAEVTTLQGGKKVTSLKFYNEFKRNNRLFWETKAAQAQDSSFFNSKFKELVNGMLESDVERRLTLNDVKNSEWYKGPILSAESLKTIMQDKYAAYKKK